MQKFKNGSALYVIIIKDLIGIIKYNTSYNTFYSQNLVCETTKS